MGIRSYLPGRNLSIFLSVTSTLVSLKVYDRHQCNQLLEEFRLRVAKLREQPISSETKVEKLLVVLTSPEKDLSVHYKSKLYFDTYIKPILDSAAYDYELVVESDNGEVSHRIYQLLSDPNLNQKVDEAGLLKEKVVGIVSVGREALLKSLLGISDCYLPYTLPPQPTSNILVQENEKEIQKQTEKEIEIEKEKSTSVQPKLEYLRHPVETSLSLNSDSVPPLFYIPFHHHYGWLSLPKRTFNWFTLRTKVQLVGNCTVEMLLAPAIKFDLNQDLDRLIHLDNRVDQIVEEVDQTKPLVLGLQHKVQLRTNSQLEN